MLFVVFFFTSLKKKSNSPHHTSKHTLVNYLFYPDINFLYNINHIHIILLNDFFKFKTY
jgi:hypothetical protein